jgi:RNase P/RNase MRP subunit p30
MIAKAVWLGYSGIGIPLPYSVSNVTISRLRQMCIDSSIDLVTRIDLIPKSINELLSQLRRCRRRFEIIGVSCLHKAVARQAAKDRRVDLLSFSELNFRNRYFDDAEAELAAGALASIEIDMSMLLSANRFERVHLLAQLRRETIIASKFSVPIVLSSGAKTESLMRKPRDFAAIAYLLDMPLTSALRAISESPLCIVTRNRTKLHSSFVAPGIRIVKRGRDC